MAEKAGSKAGENTLALIGSLAGIAGKLAFGPEFDADLGAPFKAGAALLSQNREEQNLLKLLKSTPQTSAVADTIPALIDAGGIANNMDLLDHPEVKQMIGGPSLSGVPNPGSLVGPSAPPQNLLQALQPSSPSMASSVDATSDDFLARAAELRPDIAEKVLAAKMSANPTNDLEKALRTMLLGQQIANYESPQQKRQAELENRVFQQKLNDELVTGRSEKNRADQNQIKRETWSDKETQTLNELKGASDTSLMLHDKIKSQGGPGIAASLIGQGKIGMGLMSRISPETASTIQTLRDLKKNTMAVVKSQSGVQYGYKELQWIQAAMPTEFDSDKSLQYGLASEALKNRWVYYNMVATKAQHAKSLAPAEYEGVTPEQLQAFLKLKDKLYNLPKASKQKTETFFEDPANAPELQVLGMDYLINQ